MGDVKLMIQFGGKNLTLPINPESITISQKTNNADIDIIGLGPATRKGTPGLEQLKISSFFPGSNSFYYTGVLPKTCIEFIRQIQSTDNKNNNVAKFVTTGLPIDYNMYFVIDNFDYDHKAGEEDDIYYELSIKKYVPYGAKTVNVQLSGLAAARASSKSTSTSSKSSSKDSSSNQVYVVKSGDCLWNITKACTGDGSNWKELYNLNKSVIGSNPNLIYPGQKLTLPKGWNLPSGSSSSKSSSSKNAASNTKATSKKGSNVINNVLSATSKVSDVIQAEAKKKADKFKQTTLAKLKQLGGARSTKGESSGGGFR